MRYHILNNVLGPILVYATSLISICIILAAGLSFLGLGVTPSTARRTAPASSRSSATGSAPSARTRSALPGDR